MERFGSKFHLSQIKSLLLQLLAAINYLHKNSFIHRDIKLSNILINKNGVLKLTDFGLARKISTLNHTDTSYTPKLVTLWYRAPEVLLQIGKYSWHCDVWAIGCVFAEVLNGGKPLFPGKSELNQFELICELIGKPSKLIWEDFFKEDICDKLLERVSGCKYNKIGVIFDCAIPQDILNVHLNTISALKMVQGIDTVAIEYTAEFIHGNYKCFVWLIGISY